MGELTANLEFEALLDYVKQSRGFDFTGYKRPSLIRRLDKRMQMVNIQGYSNYVDYLAVHPEEFSHLFNTLLINVTSFFRDRPAWDYIAEAVIPSILARRAAHESIRIWSAGCASGEEAYTLVIQIAEAIGIDQFRERVKIYATDLDEEALNQSRQAIYLAKDLGNLTPEQIETFFEPIDSRYTFRKDLRRAVIFGRHDLIQDAPISKIDLLVCRNTLMYFNAETQGRILGRFHFALRDTGFLFLGKAEMLLTHQNIFAPVNLKTRIFSKIPKLNLSDRRMTLAQSGEDSGQHPSQLLLREAVFDTGSLARIVVDANGAVALLNQQARSLFNLTDQDIGRPFQDLEISYRPIELRSYISQSYNDRRLIELREIEWQISSSELIYLDVQIVPLLELNGRILGASINFNDVSSKKQLQKELEHSNQELETAYEELQSANEELETTSEELQSTNEELETTNEELQSTNEELETMNEELQSTNEELQTLNEELQGRSEELNQANSFLKSILTSLRGGVVVVDRDLHVLIWNHKAEDLWGLRTAEALGQNFLNLDIGLPVEQLRQPIRVCLFGEPFSSSEVSLSAINRRGRCIQCYVTCAPLISLGGSTQGVILLMEERDNL